MAKDPAVLFYTQDFLVGTITMNFEERGKYITLLCLQHQKGKLTLKDLQTIISEEDIDLANRFPLQPDGYYYNLRMFEEAEKRKNYSESRRSNRLKRLSEEDKKKLSETYVQHMENENANENEAENVNDNLENVNDIVNELDNVIVNQDAIVNPFKK